MEEQNINLEQQRNSKRKYWKFVIGFLGIIVIVVGGFFVWERYLSPAAKSNRETQKNYEKYLAWEENYKKAMTEDTYGGKTPEETLKMFIEALKNEDIELASKYFALNSALTRDEWKQKIIENKEEMIIIVSRAVPTPNQEPLESTFWFSVYDNKGEVKQLIEMSFNPQASVWKIESL